MRLSGRFYKIYFYFVTIAFLAWTAHTLVRVPRRELAFSITISAAFFALYLLGPTVFGAKVQALDDGLHVEQYCKAVVGYTEIRRCYSLFLFPWQLAVFVTTRRFPLTVLITGDSLGGKRRSLTQDGLLAAHVRSKMTRSVGGPS